MLDGETLDQVERMMEDRIRPLEHADTMSSGLAVKLQRDIADLHGDVVALKGDQREAHTRLHDGMLQNRTLLRGLAGEMADARAEADLRADRLERAVGRLEARADGVDGRLEAVDGWMEAVDGRLAGVDGRLEAVDGRLAGVDGRLEAVDGRLAGFDGRLEAVDGHLEGIQRSIGDLTELVRSALPPSR